MWFFWLIEEKIWGGVKWEDWLCSSQCTLKGYPDDVCWVWISSRVESAARQTLFGLYTHCEDSDYCRSFGSSVDHASATRGRPWTMRSQHVKGSPLYNFSEYGGHSVRSASRDHGCVFQENEKGIMGWGLSRNLFGLRLILWILLTCFFVCETLKIWETKCIFSY